jgi:transposase
MRKTPKSSGENIDQDIKRTICKHYSSEEKVKIVLCVLRDQDSIAELCRSERISRGV